MKHCCRCWGAPRMPHSGVAGMTTLAILRQPQAQQQKLPWPRSSPHLPCPAGLQVSFLTSHLSPLLSSSSISVLLGSLFSSLLLIWMVGIVSQLVTLPWGLSFPGLLPHSCKRVFLNPQLLNAQNLPWLLTLKSRGSNHCVHQDHLENLLILRMSARPLCSSFGC